MRINLGEEVYIQVIIYYGNYYKSNDGGQIGHENDDGDFYTFTCLN